MSISIYLVLLIVLLIFNLVFWLLVIWFRILFDCELGRCCVSRSDDTEEPTGHRNLGFIDHEDLFNGPSTIAGRMESPPSYEEALKYDQFGFQMSPPVHRTTSLPSPLATAASLSRVSASSSAQDIPTSSGERSAQTTQNSPTRSPESRSRTSTVSSTCPLTPITEEEFDDSMPVTVVIDCIGVQASRLVPNCETKVDIAGGEALHGHSRC